MRRKGPVILGVLLIAGSTVQIAAASDRDAHKTHRAPVQAQAKQLRDQNQALSKRLTDLEKRQQKLEKRLAAQAQPAIVNRSLSDAMAADLPYKAAQKAPAPSSDDLCWNGVCLYGTVDMGLTYN